MEALGKALLDFYGVADLVDWLGAPLFFSILDGVFRSRKNFLISSLKTPLARMVNNPMALK
jgi:hypothetical protein